MLAVVTAVLAAHLLMLGRQPGDPGRGHRPGRAQPLQVRQIVVPAAKVAAAGAARVPAPLAPASQRLGRAETAAAAGALRPARAEAPASPGPGASPTATAVAEADLQVSAQAYAPPQAGGTPLPAYATKVPPAVTLSYSVRQGNGIGQAELRWRPADGRYLLTLERSGSGLRALGSVSQGELGALGLAPERYVESRRGCEQRAVNFQHEVGRISFSGPQLQYPLLPGAQDLLSWMLQLPAMLEAEPALREPGNELLVFVAGTRGDGQVWTFTVQGRQMLGLPAGPVADALHLRRLPSRPYDTQVDIWLDPARHHLPARLLLQVPPAPGSTEWSLGSPAAP